MNQVNCIPDSKSNFDSSIVPFYEKALDIGSNVGENCKFYVYFEVLLTESAEFF